MEYWKNYLYTVIGLVVISGIGLLISAMQYPVTQITLTKMMISVFLIAGVIAAGFHLFKNKADYGVVLMGVGALFWISARVLKEIDIYSSWRAMAILFVALFTTGLIIIVSKWFGGGRK